MLIFVYLLLFEITQPLTESRSLNLALIKEKWATFKLQHQRNYLVNEEISRFQIFFKNLFTYHTHNERFQQGKVSYKIGINQFSDMSEKEIAKITKSNISFPSFSQNFNTSTIETLYYSTRRLGKGQPKLPEQKDWVKEGAVTSVKNQRHCGSCWAFTVAGALEGAFFIKKKKLNSVSVQQLLDCSSERFGTHGCNGGSLLGGFAYVKQNGGIETEITYPYLGVDQNKCKYNRRNTAGTVKKIGRINKGSDKILKYVVTKIGPVATAIDASALYPYKSGIYAPTDCNSTNINHGVLVVGYGKAKSGQNYWLIKNSWGPSWGENGFFKLLRNDENFCGISTQAFVPLEVE